MNFTRMILLLMLTLVLPGCGGMSLTNDMSAVNTQIADANLKSQIAFGASMAACKDNAACQVAVGMAYASGMGKQAFYKPETVSDLLRAFSPYMAFGVDIARLWNDGVSGNGGTGGGFIVTGNNNSFSGINNTLKASGSGSGSGGGITATFSSSTSTSITSGNKNYNLGTDLGTVTDTGVVAAEPVDMTGVETAIPTAK